MPADHLLREIDRFLDMDGMREKLRPFYSHMGRPSIDPELIVRMLVVGYVMGFRSERRLCQDVHLNLAYRWFCRLGLDDKVPGQGFIGELLLVMDRGDPAGESFSGRKRHPARHSGL